MKRPSSVVFVFFLVIGGIMGFVRFESDVVSATTLYVGGGGPGNYTTIQAAINAAVAGDTVFVYDDSAPYYEILNIKKSINLVGENRDTTIVNGSGIDRVINVNANWVNISGFTITYGITGIRLYYSSNNKITNSNLSNNGDGIELWSSHNNNITDNYVYSNDRYGIYFYTSSTNNIIENNSAYSNNEYGICLLSSSNNNIITNNNIHSNNVGGFYLQGSSNNNIADNNFVNNGVLIVGSVLSHYNTHNIPDNNIVNGKPLYYYKNCSGTNIDGIPLGQLILANCSNVNVRNLQINNTDVGIEIAYTTNTNITNNNASSNLYGIYLLSFSSNNIIANNNLSYNDYGIRHYQSSNSNIIANNNLWNNGYGIYHHSSSNNNITNNNVSCNGIGFHLYSSSNNNITKNNVDSSSGEFGIWFDTSSGNSVIGNNVSNNWKGFYLYFSSGNRIFHNNFIENVNQAYDGMSNTWNDTYPSGGNYWSDYSPTCADDFNGATTPQIGLGGADGICDIQRNIDGDSIDYYPLIGPFNPDLAPPMITSVSALPSPQEVFGAVNISATVTDNVAVSAVYVEVRDPIGSLVGNSTMTRAISLYFDEAAYGLPLGTYNFAIWAVDTSGNWASAAGTFIIRDTTLPTITSVSALPSPQEVFGTINISATVTDNVAVSAVYVDVRDPSGILFGNFTMVEASSLYFNETAYGLPLGLYSFTIWAVDTSGNWAFAIGTFTIRDTTPPTITSMSALPSPQEVFGAVNISASVTDNVAVRAVYVEIIDPNSNLAGNLTMANAGSLYFNETAYGLPLGTYGFTIWAADVSNNWNFTAGSFVMVDTAPPSISNVAAQPSPQEFFGTVNISATVTDNVAMGAVYVEVRDPGSILMGNSTMGNAGSLYFNETAYGFPLGVYSFIIWAVDTSGNWNFADGSFVITDTTPPVADAGPDQSIEQGGTITFNGSASYDDSGVIANYTWNFTYDGAEIPLYNANPSFKFDKIGNYEVTLTVKDPSGNSAKDTMWVNVTAGDGNGGGTNGKETDDEFLSNYWWILVILAAVIIFVLILMFFVWKRRKKEEQAEEEAPINLYSPISEFTATSEPPGDKEPDEEYESEEKKS